MCRHCLRQHVGALRRVVLDLQQHAAIVSCSGRCLGWVFCGCVHDTLARAHLEQQLTAAQCARMHICVCARWPSVASRHHALRRCMRRGAGMATRHKEPPGPWLYRTGQHALAALRDAAPRTLLPINRMHPAHLSCHGNAPNAPCHLRAFVDVGGLELAPKQPFAMPCCLRGGHMWS